MAPRSDLSAVAVGAAAAGAVLIWSGVKGASVLTTLTELVRGQKPAGENVYPIDSTAETPAAGAAAAGATSASAAKILQVAASKKGQCYQFGAGHGNPCGSKCTDCSSYVSCVLSTATGKKIDMATGGLAGIGRGVPYAQRQPGDIIVWNGGTGGGHTGIISTVKGDGGLMWNNLCTGCGGVAETKYPFPARPASTAVVRRI